MENRKLEKDMSRKNRSPEEKARRAKIRELLQMANIESMDDIQDLFKETIAEFMENGLEAELDEDLGYSKYDYKNKATGILWNGIQAEKVQRAFEKLNYREQTLLEKRLAICMTCGRVGSWKDRPTFEELAVMFEGSSTSGAERAYRKAQNI